MQIRKTHAYKLGGFKKLTFNMFRKSAIRNLYGCTISDINYEYAKHLLINGIHPDTIADKLYDDKSNDLIFIKINFHAVKTVTKDKHLKTVFAEAATPMSHMGKLMELIEPRGNTDKLNDTVYYHNIPTALMSAGSVGSIKICKLLIEHGADVNKKVNGLTALTLTWWSLQDYENGKISTYPGIQKKIKKIEQTFDYLSSIPVEPPMHYNFSKIIDRKSDIRRFKRYLRENSKDEEFCHTTLNLIEKAEEEVKILELENSTHKKRN